ncbi:MAG: peptidoglycan-binding protein [Candidatus Pacebacteria bacterium]|nr:peptidoglycan-binding protein [Candidatus Paceibacterota bacterium]
MLLKNINLKTNKAEAKILQGFLLLLLICTLGTLVFSQKINALTIADVELLISIGMISPENAEGARNFANTGSKTTSSSSVKIDQTSEKECLIINQNLVKGKSGTLVSALQRFLKSEGHFPKNQSVTGFFGDMTVQAVSDFQVATGLITSSKQIGAGTIGPVTRKKIQEISCKKLVEVKDTGIATTTANVATTTPEIETVTKKTTSNKSYRPSVIYLDGLTKKSETDLGEFEFKYNIRIEPKNDVSLFEAMLVCDPLAVEVKARDVKTCGKLFEFKPSVNGTKALNILYKNLSSFTQPVVLAVEAFDSLQKSLGTAEIRKEVLAAKPSFKFNESSKSLIYNGSVSQASENCGRQEQLDFIRYTMTPYDPLNQIFLPDCWPGELLCNKFYPPTYCEITGGPSSDDLCSSRQKFENGRCVARI